MNNIKNENKQLNEENKQTKTEINNMKNKEIQLMNLSEQMINNINFLKNENNKAYNEILKNWINPSKKYIQNYYID